MLLISAFSRKSILSCLICKAFIYLACSGAIFYILWCRRVVEKAMVVHNVQSGNDGNQ